MATDRFDPVVTPGEVDGERAGRAEPLEKAAVGDRAVGWFGLLVFVLGFVTGLVASVVFGAVVVSVRHGGDIESEGLDITAAAGLGLWVGFLVVPLGVQRVRGWPGWLALRWRPKVDVVLGLAVGLSSAIVVGVVTQLVLTRTQRTELAGKAEDVIGKDRSPVLAVVLLLLLCVGTPLAEEVFFRGLLFRSLARLVPAPFAVLPSAIAFGLVHYSGGAAPVVASQLGLLTAFGAALCVLTWSTGRLGAAIMAHAAFNLVTVVTVLVGV